MKALGPGSLASILKILLDVAYYVVWAALGVASLIIVTIVFGGIYRFFGDIPAWLDQFLALEFVLALPMSAIGLAALIFIIDRLRRIFRTLTDGDPFVPENAHNLRMIAFGIGFFQILTYASFGAVSLIFTLSGRPVEGGSRVVVGQIDFNLGVWFAVLALLVLSEVFREGARLREEQKYTI
jgi:hypothetical protein